MKFTNPLFSSKKTCIESTCNVPFSSVYFKQSKFIYTDLGPVVQSIVSLTSSLRGQLVKCFTTL